jgi:phage/plasmid primase-like uncharacterized protein
MDPLRAPRGRLGASKESIFSQELRLARGTLLWQWGWAVTCDPKLALARLDCAAIQAHNFSVLAWILLKKLCAASICDPYLKMGVLC